MPNRTSKPTDINLIAANILRAATEEPTKNAAAVALGRLGGLRGRSRWDEEKVSTKYKKEIPRKAAKNTLGLLTFL